MSNSGQYGNVNFYTAVINELHSIECAHFLLTTICTLATLTLTQSFTVLTYGGVLTAHSAVATFFAVLCSDMSDSVTLHRLQPSSLYHCISYLGRSNFYCHELCYDTHICANCLFVFLAFLGTYFHKAKEWMDTHIYTYCPAVLQKDDKKLLVSLGNNFLGKSFKILL